MRILSMVILGAAFAACSGKTTFYGSGGQGAGSSSTAATQNASSSGTGGGVGFDACDGPGQCILRTPGCCGACGMPELADVAPINESQAQAFYQATCSTPGGPCPACATLPNPHLFAYCQAKRCTEADIRTHPANICTNNTDCKLRWGLGCCECGVQNQGITAIPAIFEQALRALVCKPATGCAECLPQFPPGASAVCSSGRCTSLYVSP